jgi:hypothetical protein
MVSSSNKIRFLGQRVMKKESIAVLGAGGFGLEVAMLIEQINAVELHWEFDELWSSWRYQAELT